MAVIDVTNTNTAGILVKGCSVGFGFNPEASLDIATGVFDTLGGVAIDDILVYRVNPDKIVYKGIVRRIYRKLESESINVSCQAAEMVLESKTWVPAYTAYNKDILCRNNKLNATIQDVITAEYTNNFSGPQAWFTSVELPASVASLKASPTDTYQSSFLSVISGVLSNYPHLKWCIEYAPAVTTVLPIGKLVIIDTKIGRAAGTIDVGTGVSDVTISQDASNCAGTINVYGGGDFVEVDDELIPAWNVADEAIPTVLHVTAPVALTPAVSLTTYITWGYDVTSALTITYMSGSAFVVLFANSEFNFDPKNGAIVWNQNDASIDILTGIMSVGAPGPGQRRIAARDPLFLGADLTVSFNFCGPDCYRLYSVNEPIGNLRLRMARVANPDSPGNFMEVAVGQPVVIEAFKPYNLADPDDAHYQIVAGYSIAKVWIPDETDITWDERTPKAGPYTLGSAHGYGIPIGSPEFEEGRQCVRFENRQLQVVPLYIDDQNNPTPGWPKWRSWKIKCRYTAWRNLLQTRSGTSGADYLGRFVFGNLRKYTTTSMLSNATATATVASGAVTSLTIVNPGTSYSGAPVVTISGDGTGAVYTAAVDTGRVVALTQISPGTGYTYAVVTIAASGGIIVNDTAELATTADDVRDFYGTPEWTGTASVVTALSVVGLYKVASLPYALGDIISLTGSVAGSIKTDFRGIVNSIDLAALESGYISMTFGKNAPSRNPFEPKPPVFVDVEANGNLVQDIYASRRRSS